jgi:RimJ/RimL family protein N-acetyltransferase
MVAENAARRRGVARRAISILEEFCLTYLKRHLLYAKIIDTNQPSIDLFKRSGYI